MFQKAGAADDGTATRSAAATTTHPRSLKAIFRRRPQFPSDKQPLTSRIPASCLANNTTLLPSSSSFCSFRSGGGPHEKKYREHQQRRQPELMEPYHDDDSDPPDTIPRRWARRIERCCCTCATYFPLGFVYGATTWAAWVLINLGREEAVSTRFGTDFFPFFLSIFCPSSPSSGRTLSPI